MLLKLSKLTDDKDDERIYVNTRQIIAIGPVIGCPDETRLIFPEDMDIRVKKPVKEIFERLKEYSPDMFQ